MRHLWYLSVTTVSLQALTSLFLVRREFKRRLILKSAQPA
jgi:hypothetical protein